MREGDEQDLPLTEAVDRHVRGAAHGSDIAAYLRAHGRLFVYPERGYAVLGGNGITLLAALDEEAARDILLAALHAAPTEREVRVEWITAKQQWAVPSCSTPASRCGPAEPCTCAATSGPFWPYLPSGAYL